MWLCYKDYKDSKLAINQPINQLINQSIPYYSLITELKGKSLVQQR